MCKVVEIENIISSYFLTHKEDKEVALSTLNEYKSKLENRFSSRNEFVYVDNTRDAWLNAMNRNSDLFSMKFSTNGDVAEIKLTGGYDRLKHYEDYFDAQLPFRKKEEEDIYKSVFDLLK
ncbi:MAG: hypothetical protein LBK18_01315 [Prevotellaceae bacterium]|jgi:hypothetical protein|nr:hypothetical protein [Prevotellaceae bacterium]